MDRDAGQGAAGFAALIWPVVAVPPCSRKATLEIRPILCPPGESEVAVG